MNEYLGIYNDNEDEFETIKIMANDFYEAEEKFKRYVKSIIWSDYSDSNTTIIPIFELNYLM